MKDQHLSKTIYRALFKQATTGICILDSAGTIVDANRYLSKTLRYRLQEIIGTPFFNYLDKTTTPTYSAIKKALAHNSVPPSSIIGVKRKDGQIRSMGVAFANIRNKEKRQIIIGYMHDLTESMREKKKLRKSEEKYRNLTENLSQLIYRADPNTLLVTYVNNAIETIYGYTAKEWLKDPNLWENTIHPNDKDRVFAEVTQAQRKFSNQTIVYRIIRKDKKVRWVEDHISWEKNKQGEIVSLNGVLYDITKRKQIENKLTESEARFRTLAESTPLPLLISGVQDGLVLYENKLFGPLFGYPPKSLLNSKTPDLYADPRDRNIIIAKIKKTGHLSGYEAKGKKRNGEVFDVLFSMQLITYAGDKALITTFQDITERKQLEARLKESNKTIDQKIREATRQLKEQHKVQEHYFLDLAHELKTPLTILKGGLDLALGKKAPMLQKDPKNFIRFLVTQKAEVERIDKIINDLTLLAKVDTKQVQLHFEQFRLDQLIEKVVLQMAVVSKKKQKQLTIKKLTTIDIFADREKIEYVVRNLVDNAIKFTKQKTGKVDIFLTLDRGRAKIRVKDNGVGILKKDLPHIFERFYRGANVKHRRQLKGTGLGLSIVEWIVTEHRGEIKVESARGLGTQFFIYLPLK